FLFYFLIFGSIVAVFTSVINYNIRYINIEKEIKRNALKLADNRKKMLQAYINDATNHVKSVAINPIMQEYLLQPANNDQKRSYKQQVINLFFSQMDSFDKMIKIRYIDRNGREIIRLDRKKNQTYAHIVTKLQNKSHRYYYKETKKLQAGKYWYSNLDLNLEHGKIEYPIIPTMRISTPLYSQDQFQGLVIISLKIKTFFELFLNSNDFNIYIVDKDGEFILHPESKKSWSRYLEKDYTLKKAMPQISHQILSQTNYSYKLINSFDISGILQNKDQAKLIIEPNKDIVEQLKNNNIKNAFIIILTVILASIPLALLIAYVPSKLQRKLQTALDELSKNSKIIDRHVIVYATDSEGYTKRISNAFSQITGYSKEELVSKPYTLFNTSRMYKDIAKELQEDGVWKGEIEIKNKIQETIWFFSIVTPEFAEDGKVVGYTTISHDISAKKRIEKMSITDSLTQVYNRYKIDQIFKQEIAKSAQYQLKLSVIIFDVDKFKSVNDTYGHQVGDKVLVEMTALVQKNTRPDDVLGRWGGEEFVILLPNTSLTEAKEYANGMRKQIAAYTFPKVGKKTASFGVACLKFGETEEELIKRADEALYTAKNNGRNRVES
ncbi:MAG: diguanylate cyclase, partial [Spirochaetota bacterium]